MIINNKTTNNSLVNSNPQSSVEDPTKINLPGRQKQRAQQQEERITLYKKVGLACVGFLAVIGAAYTGYKAGFFNFTGVPATFPPSIKDRSPSHQGDTCNLSAVPTNLFSASIYDTTPNNTKHFQDIPNPFLPQCSNDFNHTTQSTTGMEPIEFMKALSRTVRIHEGNASTDVIFRNNIWSERLGPDQWQDFIVGKIRDYCVLPGKGMHPCEIEWSKDLQYGKYADLNQRILHAPYFSEHRI